jgi:hypothetical protein
VIRPSQKWTATAVCIAVTTVPDPPHDQMSSSMPRRLAVLRSHLLPDEPAPPGEERERHPADAAAWSVSTSTCAGGGAAGGGDGDGGEESCVFCQIIRGDAPAYKVRGLFSLVSRLCSFERERNARSG